MALSLGARLLLSGVFAVAGVAKLAHPWGSRAAIEGFGVPARFAGAAGRLLPVAELASAVALFVPISAWWGAVAAAGLVALFIAVISASLARGRTPDCHCFGQLHSTPVGPWTLLRNVALIALAALVISRGSAAPEVSPVGWVDRVSAVELVLICAAVVLLLVAGLGWFSLQLFRQNGRILARLEAFEQRLAGIADPAQALAGQNAGNGKSRRRGLPVGAVAPRFELPALKGELVSLAGLCGRGTPVLLVFTDPGCGPCTELLPTVAGWQREHVDRLIVALISRGGIDKNRANAQEHGLIDVLVQEDREVAEAYVACETPSAMLVSSDGDVASSVATGAEAINDLVVSVTEREFEPDYGQSRRDHVLLPEPPRTPKLEIGDEVPDLAWVDLNGLPTSLRALRGRSVALIFWNPDCGFCERLLPDLKVWHESRSSRSAQPVLVSSGTQPDNRSLGLHMQIVIEESFQTGSMFGATGTPSAILINEAGAVESALAIGQAPVLSLLRKGTEGSRTRGRARRVAV
jgi:peroxiredoxin